jgi:hypothetical protein
MAPAYRGHHRGVEEGLRLSDLMLRASAAAERLSGRLAIGTSDDGEWVVSMPDHDGCPLLQARSDYLEEALATLCADAEAFALLRTVFDRARFPR